MISNVCKIEKGVKDLNGILKECEKVAVYNELDKKSSMHLRLLCEELDGMLPELVGDFEGKLHIEFVDGVCKIVVSIEIDEMDQDRRNELIGIAKNKKNAASVGIIGRIRTAIENFLLDTKLSGSLAMTSDIYNMASESYTGMSYSHCWSLSGYRNTVKEEDKKDEWDELEKSVIASISDDVLIGVKGRRADIVIIKSFK